MMDAQATIYGLHAVAAQLDQPGTVTAVWALAARHDRRLETLLERARAGHIPVERVSRQRLSELSGTSRHQGVVARIIVAAEARDEGALKERFPCVEGAAFLLVLDGVQDPHNLGACLRSAAAAGAHGVIIPRDRAVGLTPVVRKVAAGAADLVPVYQVTNLARMLRWLRDQGVWLVGTAAEESRSIYDLDLTGPLALVLGAEGRGLRRLTREQCDYLAAIPMAGRLASLNVSVAAGVCLFEAVRQRRGPGTS